MKMYHIYLAFSLQFVLHSILQCNFFNQVLFFERSCIFLYISFELWFCLSVFLPYPQLCGERPRLSMPYYKFCSVHVVCVTVLKQTCGVEVA